MNDKVRNWLSEVPTLFWMIMVIIPWLWLRFMCLHIVPSFMMSRLIALRDVKAVLLQRSRRQTLRSHICICISGIILRRGSCVPKYLHDFYNGKLKCISCYFLIILLLLVLKLIYLWKFCFRYTLSYLSHNFYHRYRTGFYCIYCFSSCSSVRPLFDWAQISPDLKIRYTCKFVLVKGNWMTIVEMGDMLTKYGPAKGRLDWWTDIIDSFRVLLLLFCFHYDAMTGLDGDYMRKINKHFRSTKHFYRWHTRCCWFPGVVRLLQPWYRLSGSNESLSSMSLDVNSLDHPIVDSKVHWAYLGPTWGRQDPGGPHVVPMSLAIRYVVQW